MIELSSKLKIPMSQKGFVYQKQGKITSMVKCVILSWLALKKTYFK